MTLSAAEQLLIEMINRARLDPVGEAERFSIDLNEGLAPGTLDGSVRQVLAPNALLHDAAQSHSEWMLATDTFSHTGAAGSSPGDRMADAGYDFLGRYANGENITYRGSMRPIDLDTMIEEHHWSLFLSAGHRDNMLHDFYRELGVSQQEGVFNSRGIDFNASMVTENFALSGSDVFLTGVSYTDGDGDDFYSIGEGRSGVRVSAGGQTVRSTSEGGYAIALMAGADVTVTLGDIHLRVDLSTGNGKLDLVNGTEVLTSVDATLQGVAGSLTALGVGDINLTGHAGADTLIGNVGDNILNGGGGTDVVRYDIARSGATLSEDAQGHVRVVSSAGTDTLIDIERVQFRDQTVNLETIFVLDSPPEPQPDTASTPDPGSQTETSVVDDMGHAGSRLVGTVSDDTLYAEGFSAVYAPEASAQVYRLYVAALGREPDVGGHASWTEALSKGARTLADVAAGFVGSAEFRATYGDLDAAAFVDLLYQNVLERTADAGGRVRWVESLEMGGMSRAEALVGFSESSEFTAATDAAASGFTQARDAGNWTDDIFRLYQATLNRVPDLGGMRCWTDNLTGGGDFATVVTGFVTSPEFRATYGDLDDRGFVDLLYQNVLGRAGDAAGVQGWLDTLEAGGSRAEVVTGFSQSAELRAETEAQLEMWVRAQGVQNVIAGDAGDDMMAGGALSDIFIFEAGAAGDNTVLDLEAWDVLRFGGFGYADADAMQMHLAQQGDDVVFANGSVTITFEDVDLSMFTDEMIQV